MLIYQHAFDGELDVMARKKIDPVIRAKFKENARRIISEDRTAKRSGASQNTIGVIERSLVFAYQLGLDGVSTFEYADDAEKCVDWIILAPRMRDVLRSMTWSFSSFRRTPTYEPTKLARLKNGSLKRWFVFSHHEEVNADHGFLDGPVKKLIELKLLTKACDDPEVLELTELGTNTCKAYWLRSDNNDPTLPLMSVR